MASLLLSLLVPLIEISLIKPQARMGWKSELFSVGVFSIKVSRPLVKIIAPFMVIVQKEYVTASLDTLETTVESIPNLIQNSIRPKFPVLITVREMGFVKKVSVTAIRITEESIAV
jgi:hypothetical protein